MNNTIVVPLNDTVIFTVLTTLFILISVLSCGLEIFLIIRACCSYFPSTNNINQEQELQSVEQLQLRHSANRELSLEEVIELTQEKEIDTETTGKNNFQMN